MQSGVVVALAFVAAAAGCGGGGGGAPKACGNVGACGPTARCLGSTCVEDVAPNASVTGPRGVEALALAEFDGSASSDADAAMGDEIKSFHWSFLSLDDHCPAPTVTGTEAKARVRFGCAGSFRVSLSVVDELGKESEPASVDVAVAPTTSALVIASLDQSVGHRCTGVPRVCRIDGTAPVVSARLADGVLSLGTVTYEWTVETPLDAHKRVSLTPSAHVANPSVYLEVDESEIQAIKTDWVFRVVASDDVGPIGEATTRISVKNRPPVLVTPLAAISVNHTYSGGKYHATVEASTWADPDGDPMSLSGSTGSGACNAVSLESNGTAVIDCVRTFVAPSDLADFAKTHTVAIRPKDPWDAAASSATAVTILNRGPTASATATGAVPPAGVCEAGECCAWSQEPGSPRDCLSYAYVCAAYVAHPKPNVSDPDGDPLTLSWTWKGGGGGSKVCEPGNCTTDLNVPGADGCDTAGSSTTGAFTVSDGLGTASNSLSVGY